MIKKLMNISGAQVLGKEELNHVMGGEGVAYVCADGTKGYGGVNHEEAFITGDFMCKTQGGIGYLVGREK
jgi:hypothetical protein